MTAALALLAAVAVADPLPPHLDAVGLGELRQRLGDKVPTGAGVAVAQVEAAAGDAYLPDAAAFPGKAVVDRGGGGKASGHANGVGSLFYGPAGVAPGIPRVLAFRLDGRLGPNDWFGGAGLRVGSRSAPALADFRVQNHSWVAATDPPAALVRDALRRVDFLVARDNVVVVVGVNNGVTPVPALLGGGYNSVAVGRSDGQSSVGPAAAEAAGRSKPDVVAPVGLTSHAAPLVAGAAALLLETAAGKADAGERERAGRAETVKAALLSGATKGEFARLDKPWRAEAGEPLDRRFGAGELNVNNSHLILSAPEADGTDDTPDGPAGWDYETPAGEGQVRRYHVDVPASAKDPRLTATVVWLRRLPQAGADFSTAAALANFDLRVSDGGQAAGESRSAADNVEHVWAGVTPGRRATIEVRLAGLPAGQGAESFAVAWRLDGLSAGNPVRGSLP